MKPLWPAGHPRQSPWAQQAADPLPAVQQDADASAADWTAFASGAGAAEESQQDQDLAADLRLLRLQKQLSQCRSCQSTSAGGDAAPAVSSAEGQITSPHASRRPEPASNSIASEPLQAGAGQLPFDPLHKHNSSARDSSVPAISALAVSAMWETLAGCTVAHQALAGVLCVGAG